jgi:hypothetical protein
VYTKFDENIVNFGEISNFWNLMYPILQKYSRKDEYFVCDDIFGPK